MRTRCRGTAASLAAFLVTVVAVVVAVRAWRRHAVEQSGARAAPPPVTDTVLADRVRSELGGLTHALDIPHVHVMVERDVAMLHGDVRSDADARAIVRRVREVPGVRDVVSYLHVGLLASDAQPSEGAREPSAAARRLAQAARRAGGGEVTAEVAARSVLATFASVVPPHTRRRMASHLPLDVAAWLTPPARVDTSPIRTVDELYAAVAAGQTFPPAHAPWVVAAVLAELQALLPDDAADVALDLGPDLRHVWEDAAPHRHT